MKMRMSIFPLSPWRLWNPSVFIISTLVLWKRLTLFVNKQASILISIPNAVYGKTPLILAKLHKLLITKPDPILFSSPNLRNDFRRPVLRTETLELSDDCVEEEEGVVVGLVNVVEYFLVGYHWSDFAERVARAGDL